jgi:hypothetical protein
VRVKSNPTQYAERGAHRSRQKHVRALARDAMKEYEPLIDHLAE